MWVPEGASAGVWAQPVSHPSKSAPAIRLHTRTGDFVIKPGEVGKGAIAMGKLRAKKSALARNHHRR